MRGSFFGLNVAVTGLLAAQRNLDVVSHNINNVNTPGYSRQEGLQKATTPLPLYDGSGMLGTGSRVYSIKRVRDEYLDSKYWNESKTLGEMDAKMVSLSDLEALFNEPSDSGYTAIMNTFYNGLQELSKDPTNDAIRALVRENGISLTKYFNSTAAHFDKLQADINDKVKTKVEEVNSLAKRISELNRQIYFFELDGNTANDLRDERGVLVDQMSRLVNIETNEITVGKHPNGLENKHFVISINGKSIVDHFNTSLLSAVKRDTQLNSEDISGLYEVEWQDGNTLELKSGEIKGYLDMRDGNDGDPAAAGYTGPLAASLNYKGIPYYQRKLNEFVRQFAMAFNEGQLADASGNFDGHVKGYGMDINGTGQKTGIRFFTMLDSGDPPKPLDSVAFDGSAAAYAQLTAKNFSLSMEVTDNARNIATASSPNNAEETGILKNLINTQHDKKMFAMGEPNDFMKALIVNIGISSQYAKKIADNQTAIVDHIIQRRTSESGVSLDEEMANMVKFQHAYNASAKMITTMAEVYDTLINKMGVR